MRGIGAARLGSGKYCTTSKPAVTHLKSVLIGPCYYKGRLEELEGLTIPSQHLHTSDRAGTIKRAVKQLDLILVMASRQTAVSTEQWFCPVLNHLSGDKCVADLELAEYSSIQATTWMLLVLFL